MARQEVNYTVRLTICSLSSFTGLLLLAFSPYLPLRVLGISLTSLSSNLGDMSFYQMATRYPISISHSFGGYAAGSGAAGLIGSAMYTVLTGGLFELKTKFVLGGMAVVPAIMLSTWGWLLPDFETASSGEDEENGKEAAGNGKMKIADMKVRDKLKMVKPMIWGYMLPLATMMLLENTTIQVLPTWASIQRSPHKLKLTLITHTSGRSPNRTLSPSSPNYQPSPRLPLRHHPRLLPRLRHYLPTRRLLRTYLNHPLPHTRWQHW